MSDGARGSVVVEATPRQVLAVIADLEAYPEWNAEFAAVDVLERGAAPEHRPLRVRVRLESPTLSDEFELAYRWQDDRVSWELASPGEVLRRLTGSYAVRPEGETRTEVTYELEVAVSMPLLGALRRKAAAVVIERALSGLRQRVEEMSWD